MANQSGASKKWPGMERGVRFTPWKAGICFASVALTFATVGLLNLVVPGDAEHATTRQIMGGTEFNIKSIKWAWLELAFWCCFLGYPTLFSWLLWGRLKAERCERNESRYLGNMTNLQRLFQLLVYFPIAALLALLALVLVMVFLLHPWRHIHRVTIEGKNIRLESLYRSWNRSCGDIQKVAVERELDERGGGFYADYRLRLECRDGDRFESAALRARPPDGQKDKHYERFFANLRTELMKP